MSETRKIIRDKQTTDSPALTIDTNQWTIPEDCVNIEVEFITDVEAADVHYFELLDANASLVIRVAEWKKAGSYYVNFPPIKQSTTVKLVGDNGTSATGTFRYKITFYVEIS